MTPHPKELEDLLRTLAHHWQSRGAGGEILGCLDAEPPAAIIKCCSQRLGPAARSNMLDYEGLLRAQLGLAHWMLEQGEPAVEQLERAAQLFRFRDRWSAAVVLLIQGRIFAHLDRRGEASRSYAEVLQLLPRDGPLALKAEAWRNDLNGKGGGGWRSPLPPAPAETVRAARELRNAGQRYADQGEFPRALEKYQAAIARIDGYADPHLVGECHELIGDALVRLHEWGQAVDAYDRAIPMFELCERQGRVRTIKTKRQQAQRNSGDDSSTRAVAPTPGQPRPPAAKGPPPPPPPPPPAPEVPSGPPSPAPQPPAAEGPEVEAEPESSPAPEEEAPRDVPPDEEAPGALSELTSSAAAFPWFISKARRQELFDLGYPHEVVDKMTAEEADKIVRAQHVYLKPAAASPAPPVEAAAAPAPDAVKEAPQPIRPLVVFIPKTPRQELYDLGYPLEVVDKLTLAAVDEIVRTRQVYVKPALETSAPVAEAPVEAPTAEGPITETEAVPPPPPVEEAPPSSPEITPPPPREIFTFPRVPLAPVLAGDIPAGTPLEPRLLTSVYIEASAIEINGKAYGLRCLLNGERYLRLRSFDLGVIVGGKSMEPTIRDGDCVLLKKLADLPDECIVVVRAQATNGDVFTVKRYRHCGDHIFLYPDNPEYNSYILAETEELGEKLRWYYAGQITPDRLEVIVGPETLVEGRVVAILGPLAE